MTWYQATRYIFSSQCVLFRLSIEQLREMMGHSTVQVTDCCAHLRPALFGDGDRAAL